MPREKYRDLEAERDEAVDDKEELKRQRDEARQQAARLKSAVALRSFPRLRLNVTNLSPGYVTCSMFQSDNAGTNWACVGSGITFPEGWFKETFGLAVEGRRIECTITGVHEVVSDLDVAEGQGRR